MNQSFNQASNQYFNQTIDSININLQNTSQSTEVKTGDKQQQGADLSKPRPDEQRDWVDQREPREAEGRPWEAEGGGGGAEQV